MKRILFIQIIILFLIGQVFPHELYEVVKKVYSKNEISKITMSNLNGNIRITGKETDKIEIIAYKFVYSKSKNTAKEQLSKLEVEFEKNDDELIIHSQFPKNYDDSFPLFKKIKEKCLIDYEIILPVNFNFDVKTTNGDLVFKNVTGEIYGKSVNGTIKAINLAGTIDISSVNGSLTAYLENGKEINRVNLKTVNGHLLLKMLCNTGCTINAETVNGRINVPRSTELNRKYHGREAYGEINGGGIPIKLKSVNGTIEFIPL